MVLSYSRATIAVEIDHIFNLTLKFLYLSEFSVGVVIKIIIYVTATLVVENDACIQLICIQDYVSVEKINSAMTCIFENESCSTMTQGLRAEGQGGQDFNIACRQISQPLSSLLNLHSHCGPFVLSSVSICWFLNIF